MVQMCSAWAEARAEEDLSVPGEREIPAVTDSRYSHGMFEISELEHRGFCPIFFKILLAPEKIHCIAWIRMSELFFEWDSKKAASNVAKHGITF